jgi:hypothetical protein
MAQPGPRRSSTAIGRLREKLRANTRDPALRHLAAHVPTRVFVQEARSGSGRDEGAARGLSVATPSEGWPTAPRRSRPQRYRRPVGTALRAMSADAKAITALSAVACAIWVAFSLVPQVPFDASAAGYDPGYGYTTQYLPDYTTQYPPGYTTQYPTTTESTGGETTPIGCGPDPANPVTEGTVKVGDLDCDGDVDEGDRRAADLNGDGVVNSTDDHTGDGVVDRADLELDRYAVQATAAAQEALDGGAAYAQAEKEAIGAATDAGASAEQAGTVAETGTAHAMGGVVADSARGAMPVGISPVRSPRGGTARGHRDHRSNRFGGSREGVSADRQGRERREGRGDRGVGPYGGAVGRHQLREGSRRRAHPSARFRGTRKVDLAGHPGKARPPRTAARDHGEDLGSGARHRPGSCVLSPGHRGYKPLEPTHFEIHRRQLAMALGCNPRAVGGRGVEMVQEAERPECRE